MLINFINGTEIFRYGIHINCYTGIIHGICFPIATVYFFNILHLIGWSKLIYPIIMFFGYDMILSSDTVLDGISCFVFYIGIGYLSQLQDVGWMLSVWRILQCIAVMEFIGHWYLESTSSILNHFLNSVYHTPVYGFQSVLSYPYNCTW